MINELKKKYNKCGSESYIWILFLHSKRKTVKNCSYSTISCGGKEMFH